MTQPASVERSRLTVERRLLVEMLRRERAARAAADAGGFSLVAAEDRGRLPPGLEDAYPLASMQQGMLFHLELTLGRELLAYHNVFLFDLPEAIAPGPLRRAVQRVVDRHPVLRTSFDLASFGEPLQLVHRHVRVTVPCVDLSALDAERRRRELDRHERWERSRPLDPARPPQVRFCLHLLAADRSRLTMTESHAVSEGWSTYQTLGEIRDFYRAFATGRQPPPHRPLPPLFREFVRLERDAMASAATREFWREHLSGAQPTPLPRWPDHLRGRPPARRTHVLPLGEDRVRRLVSTARALAVPLKTLLLAVLVEAIGAMVGRDDVVVGLHVHGRPEARDGENVRGVFNNTVPLRARLRRGSWRRLIADLFAAEREIAPHQRYPLAALQAEHGAAPLVETLLGFVHFHLFGEVAISHDLAIPTGSERSLGHFPLCVFFQGYGPGPREIVLWIENADARITSAQVLALQGVCRRGVDALLAGLDGERRELFLSAAERHLLLREWNDAPDLRGEWPDVVAALAERRSTTPDAVAVARGDEHLTWAALDARAAALAAALAARGIGCESPVAVLAERGPRLIAALFGILRCGAAYLPLDPRQPARRIAMSLAAAAPAAVLVEPALAPILDEAAAAESARRPPAIDLVAALAGPPPAGPPAAAPPRSLAYVLFTSGSTGVPKGAMVERRGMRQHLAAKVEELALSAGDVVAQTASQSFDVSLWQMLAASLVGAVTRVYPDEVAADPRRLLTELERHGVTICEIVPSLLAALVAEAAARGGSGGALPALRWMIPTGEALPPELAARWFDRLPGVPLLNAYGPTECSDDVAHRHLDRPPPAGAESVPIGRRLPGTRLYVLDRELMPLPPGVLGELHVGGEQVGRGYLGEPVRTAASFVPDPFSAGGGERLYRTGDLARFLPDGDLDFAGRRDHQVKVRGFRVELGEVEAALRALPRVEAAVVVARPGTAGPTLVAYLVAGEAIEPRRLRAQLLERLPSHMVPSAFVLVPGLPLTPNGKVDRRALPEPAARDLAASESGEPPRTPHEELVAALWSRLLGVEVADRRAHFFELGGHSLLATRLMSRVRQAFAVDLPLATLFESPTLAAFSRRVEAAAGGGRPLAAVPRLPRDGRPLPLSFAQERLWFLDQLEPGRSVYNVATALEVAGALVVGAVAAALGEILRRHEVLRSELRSVDGRPEQRPAEVNLRLPVVDLSGLAAPDRDRQARLLAAEEAGRPFDLSLPPLVRARLLRRATDDHVAIFTLHHVVSDGWSTALLVRETTRLYEAAIAGRPSPLAELPVQYADFAAWQRRLLADGGLDEQLAYWRRRLAGAPERMELPFDRPREDRRAAGGAVHVSTLPSEVGRAVAALALAEGATPFMVLLAAFKAVLFRLTGQTDLVVGTDVANRRGVELEELIGFFVNHLVMRTDLSGRPRFRELVARVRRTCLEAYQHQDLPFVRLVRELRPQRTLSHLPLFQVLFVLQNAPRAELTLPEVSFRTLELPADEARFDLAVFAVEDARGLVTTWSYSTELFDADTVAGFARCFEALLADATARPEARLDELRFVNETERERSNMDLGAGQTATGLRNRRRRGVDTGSLVAVEYGALEGAGDMPLVVRPAGDVDPYAWATANRGELGERLERHGAVLFRDFPLRSVADFERFAGSVCADLFAEYGDLPREQGAERVYRSTPYPADKHILFHNESSHMHRWPVKQLFFCVTPAAEGGETPIVDCRRILRRLPADLTERFAGRGLLYVRNFTPGFDVPWQEFFRTADRAAVEDYCRRSGIDFEWTGDDGLRTRQRAPAVVAHPRSGELSFFNQIQLHHPACLDDEVRRSMAAVFAPGETPRNVLWGDGTPLADDLVRELLDLYWQEAVAFRWQAGDVLLVDNMLVAHARNPFSGPRKIAVAMGELFFQDALR